MKAKDPAPNEYQEFLTEVRQRIFNAWRSTARAVNAGLIALYWDLGRHIVETQAKRSWGDRVLEMLAQDLKKDFPNKGGFSGRNLRYMRAFWRTYTTDPFWQQSVAKLDAVKPAHRDVATTAATGDSTSHADPVLTLLMAIIYLTNP